ncbi:MAG: hypothetical protein AB1521_14610 [Bacteroidota bacterium]
MFNTIKVICFLLVINVHNYTFCLGVENQSSWLKKEDPDFVLFYTSIDSAVSNEIYQLLTHGFDQIINYFGKSYNKKFDVYIFPSREELDKQWSKDWGIPDFKSECWMAASGVAYRLDILSPRVWKAEACEHNPDDKKHVQEIITHELMHVFHGQQNSHPDFSGMDEIGWFVEGIAVLTAGQLDNEKLNQLKNAWKENRLPINLEDGWSGKYRYAISGSLVKFIEERWGKEKLIGLLKLTNENEILKEFNLSEELFLSEWKKWLNFK